MSSNDWTKYIHVNCRTCSHSTPEPNSTWTCARYDGANIEVEYQHQGCDSHALHPDLVPWEMRDSGVDFVACYIIDGEPVLNGDGHFLSREILANPEGCTSDLVKKVRRSFPGAEVVR